MRAARDQSIRLKRQDPLRSPRKSRPPQVRATSSHRQRPERSDPREATWCVYRVPSVSPYFTAAAAGLLSGIKIFTLSGLAGAIAGVPSFATGGYDCTAVEGNVHGSAYPAGRPCSVAMSFRFLT